MRCSFRIIVTLCILLASGQQTALAHSVGENYIFLNFRQDAIDGRFEVHLKDLEEKLGIAVEKAGSNAIEGVRLTAPRVQDYIRGHFSIAATDGPAYSLEFTDVNLLAVPEGTFAQYYFRARAMPLPDRFVIRHSMLYEGDRLHRGLLLVEFNAKTGISYGAEHIAMVFGPMSSEQSLDLRSVPRALAARDMIWQGVLHIWIGIDHVLFLVALMLPTVLVLAGNHWQPVSDFHKALWNVLKIVTVFTIAHSVTLLLAATGVLDVPSRLVESVIALSIALVALNNITGRMRDASLLVILTLGLFHGLGFATVMGHLPFRTVTLLKAVLGFNIGVELGQLAIVAVVFPALFLLRSRPLYMPVVLKGGSFALILVAGAWFVQRAFGME